MNKKPAMIIAMVGIVASSMMTTTSLAATKTKTATPKFEQYYNIKYLNEANEIFKDNKKILASKEDIHVLYAQPPYTAFIKTKRNTTVFVTQGKKVLYHKKLVGGVGFLKLTEFDYSKPVKVYATSKNHRKSTVKSYKFKLYKMNK
ncbi:hypothetical protein [Lactiplantibacillus mudanjiangensis]|uniref:Uncharacterized protein n=1 Tax=Lactiplantibacillus mudanjiangensis TaxID=1296538 RepID=A0A660DWK2_9LACO|nr:hypothetical protein [Lactiplantibacillus mudanjiangensis]VDG18910.1 hypothetical protein MUDAN_BIHEEGNE_00813 [Lactiplantibacillus mudanjiangensis]VDG25311.1 hypothetical protein MUDAN_IGPPGNFN_01050 [Lactiplantibacillus mudanjiangensis]VDG27662.1 hypothetical protein MUDAN_MDHGFNIF_02503 [Lactiplantibacillus mudanjiangensis]